MYVSMRIYTRVYICVCIHTCVYIHVCIENEYKKRLITTLFIINNN